ncbi:MAG: 4'-phosphopantetheinyl transferase superfamily protein [Mycoplasmoidaceae bacterium]
MKNNYSIGIDLTLVSNFSKQNSELIDRYLSENEKYNLLLIGDNKLKETYLAKIWAIKEAIYKADNNLLFKKLDISFTKNAAPICINYPEISISISHCNGMIAAIALIIKK